MAQTPESERLYALLETLTKACHVSCGTDFDGSVQKLKDVRADLVPDDVAAETKSREEAADARQAEVQAAAQDGPKKGGKKAPNPNKTEEAF